MTINVRPYKKQDYQNVIALYKESNLYGGQFDENRDSEERINIVISKDPQSILVCENAGDILRTVSLIENVRVAWLFRFAVQKTEFEKSVTEALYNQATEILKERGHNEVLVYFPADGDSLAKRYTDLGMNKGGSYSCFWASLD